MHNSWECNDKSSLLLSCLAGLMMTLDKKIKHKWQRVQTEMNGKNVVCTLITDWRRATWKINRDVSVWVILDEQERMDEKQQIKFLLFIEAIARRQHGAKGVFKLLWILLFVEMETIMEVKKLDMSSVRIQIYKGFQIKILI